MSKKHFYSVSKGIIPGIYTTRSKCELNVHRYPHAVFKGFNTIDQAVAFLIAGSAFVNCHLIPVYDDSESSKHPKDFGHECSSPPCTVENMDTSLVDIGDINNICSEQMSENKGPVMNDIESNPLSVQSPDNEDTDPKTLMFSDTSDNEMLNNTLTPIFEDSVNTDKIEETVPKSSAEITPESNIQCKSEGNINDSNTQTCNNKSETDTRLICTQLCEEAQNAYMIQCSKCRLWTHYRCTRLPTYQLYLLTSTSRRYNCEKCTNVPPSFIDKWSNHLTGNKNNYISNLVVETTT